MFNPYAAGGLFDQYKLMQKTEKMIETLVAKSIVNWQSSLVFNPYAAGS